MFSNVMCCIPRAAIEELSCNVKRVIFRPGEFIHNRGDSAELLYYVEEGKVRINSVSKEGKELIVKDLMKGEWFGLIGCFGSKIRPNDAITLEHTTVATISISDFTKVANKHPNLWLCVTKALASYVENYYERLMSGTFDTLLVRTEDMLRQLASWQGSQNLKISQSDLASLLGVTKEAVGIQLNQLKKDNKVILGYKTIILLSN